MQNAMDWERTDLFWGDERCVPPDAPESNYSLARATLFARAIIPEENIHRIKGELGAQAAAEDYQNQLQAYCSRMGTEQPRLWLRAPGDRLGRAYGLAFSRQSRAG